MQPFPALKGAVETDLLVIGGGFAGLSTALHAAEAGQSVVLLEAHRIAWGASGRNAGFVVPNFAKVDPDGIRGMLGPRAEPLINMAAGSGDLVFDLIRRHQITCDAQQSGWLQPSHSDAAFAKAKDRVRQWSALQRPVQVLDAAGIAAMTGVAPDRSGWRGGWIDRSGGVINPVGYARGLARAATAAGAVLHEASPVTALQQVGAEWLASTPQGQIKARQVVLATNAYAGGLWPGLARSFFPLRVFQVATQPLPDAVRNRLLPGNQSLSDSRRNLFTFRFDAANRLISGGMPIVPWGADRRLPRAIHRRLAQMLDLPDLPPLQFQWSGMASVMPDFLPRVVKLAPGLLAGFACNGRGIALSTAMGRELADWASGTPADALAIPLKPAAPIPAHALARLAPNALLPFSILRDRIENKR
ncbi:oxidoreductase [Cypionkella aquatica]|uniref:Oxidoreductase n=1 Tax=Cypionkella aquatica TaxID=1756042 RepID=A0AA37WZ35_9RHOB|nr:oxidoreductase [Cypionkella aquatica]